jgi:hypothetical protein
MKSRKFIAFVLKVEDDFHASGNFGLHQSYLKSLKVILSLVEAPYLPHAARTSDNPDRTANTSNAFLWNPLYKIWIK